MQYSGRRIANHRTAQAFALVAAFVSMLVGAGHADEFSMNSSSTPISHRLDDWIASLGDDRASVRSDASDRILRWAKQSSVTQRDSLIQSLLRTGLIADLDLQMLINRLIDQIREAEFASTIAGFLDQSTRFENPLESSWQTFAARALNRSDSREVFARVALQAGPSLNWQAINHRRRAHPEPSVLVSHLGCVAPIRPRFFLPESQVIYAKLIANQRRSVYPTVATRDARVLCRLLDATILNNPYGWTIEQRLRLALIYQRDVAAIKVADAIMQSKDRLPIDWTAAMLAVRQVEQRSGWIDVSETADLHAVWASRIHAINESLEDSRTLALQPAGRPVPMIRKNQNAPKGQPPLFQSAIVRTRVQDVAAWILLDRSNQDPRSHGMLQIEADSTWGVHRESVGFANNHDRELAIAAAKL